MTKKTPEQINKLKLKSAEDLARKFHRSINAQFGLAYRLKQTVGKRAYGQLVKLMALLVVDESDD